MTRQELKKLHSMDRARWGNRNHLKLWLLDGLYRMVYRFRKVQYFQSHKWMYPMYMIERLLYFKSYARYGCEIPSHAHIGGGLKPVHGWATIINADAIVGDNLTIQSGAIIGTNGKGVPTIGNNVTIGAHALVLGPIIIGDNAIIGAGAIVTHDVPSGGVVYSEASSVHRVITDPSSIQE